MDKCKIPKPLSAMRAPSKLPMSSQISSNLRGATSKTKILVPAVSKKTVDDIKVVPASLPKIPKNALRRRSKSVADLKLVTPSLNKATVKRPLATRNDEDAVKPKIAKVKIPSWDYKARFLDLQQKHGGIVEENKELKNRLAPLEALGDEFAQVQAQNAELQRSEVLYKEKIAILDVENKKLKIALTEINDKYSCLEAKHTTLQQHYNEQTKELANLKTKHKEAISSLTSYESKCTYLEKLQAELKQDLDQQQDLRRQLHNTIQDLKGNIRVFCRVRPPVTEEEHDTLLCNISFPNESTMELKKSRESICSINRKATNLKHEFNFDKVFPPEASQAEVFEELSQLVQSALDGYHVCVFAYGQTGSGKTFTMQGSLQNSGMIPRTIDLIFQKIDQLKSRGWTYKISASFVEIYNENVQDLLSPNGKETYELKYNEGRGVTITNLKIVEISNGRQLKRLMNQALSNRAVAATDFNEASSRSHAVTKITLEGTSDSNRAVYSGSINLVDLAGSESAKTSSSERLTETKNINQSLSTLGNVMLALHNKDSHVPYRNSKLTFLLQSCLGGNSKTLMIVNISPFEECFNESINSLRFASRVKEIKMSVKKNKCYSSLPSTKEGG